MANRSSTASSPDFYDRVPSVQTTSATGSELLDRFKDFVTSPWPAYTGLYAGWILVLFSTTGGWRDPAKWYEAWNKWDAAWYAKIWQDGYAKDLAALAFPPGYSLTIGSLASVLNSTFPATAFMINVPAFFLAAGLFAQTAEERFRVPGPALFLFFISSPAAYFAFAPYSDAFFLLLFWMALPLALKNPVALSKREKISVLGLMLLMPWVRLVGYALFAWVVTRRWYAAAVLISLAAWLALNQTFSGSPFHFLETQSKFLMAQGGFISGLTNTAAQLTPAFSDPRFEWTPWIQYYALPALNLILIFATAVWFSLKREWLLAVTIVSITFFSHNQAFWRSAVRYDLVLGALVAIPILSHILDERRPFAIRWVAMMAFTVLTVGGFILQIYFANLFRAGSWGF